MQPININLMEGYMVQRELGSENLLTSEESNRSLPWIWIQHTPLTKNRELLKSSSFSCKCKMGEMRFSFPAGPTSSQALDFLVEILHSAFMTALSYQVSKEETSSQASKLR